MDASADLLKVNHRLESRVPEIGLLGSEGGATSSVVPTPITRIRADGWDYSVTMFLLCYFSGQSRVRGRARTSRCCNSGRPSSFDEREIYPACVAWPSPGRTVNYGTRLGQHIRLRPSQPRGIVQLRTPAGIRIDKAITENFPKLYVVRDGKAARHQRGSDPRGVDATLFLVPLVRCRGE